VNKRLAHTLAVPALSAFALTLVLVPAVWASSHETASAEEIVDAMIEAHGGMEAWASAPTVSFEDRFSRPGAEEPGPWTRVVVEQGPRRAYIDVLGTDMHMAWDGEKAWSVNWKMPTPPRFLALLNYYFVNLPWLAKDPGVLLGQPGKAKLWDDPTEYITIKVTYESGVGDTPEDYYVLYIHPETHQLKGCEYIVTYKSLLPEGVAHTPPHILVFEEFETVSDLVVPTKYTIYETDQSVYASCEIRNWSFSKSFDSSRMEMPEGAVIDETEP